MPDGPGPEVTALADRDGRVWMLGQPMRPEQDTRPGWWCDGQCFPFDRLLFYFGPLTDQTPPGDATRDRFYTLHEHSWTAAGLSGFERHAHHVDQGHPGNWTNRNHEGIDVVPWDELPWVAVTRGGVER
jgi:hypothetical protein